MKKEFIRRQLFKRLWQRLQDNVNLIQVIIGPRQIGKTTLALQILKKWSGPKLYQTADEPGTPSLDWLDSIWQRARKLSSKSNVLLIIDEIQKIPGWSGFAKKLFDEDKRNHTKIRVVILGSSSLLVQKGLTESLAGRFEMHRHYQWSFQECQDLFKLKLNEYLYFGGYPGALVLRKDESRWMNYIRDSLIETVLSKDILLMSAISKPALLRQTFSIAVSYPAQIISYQKVLGTLHDAGNTTTIASYLRLLSSAFLVSPLEKYSGTVVKQKGSTPKIIVYDNSLISAINRLNFKKAMADKIWFGRILENAVGARLKIIMEKNGGELFYWRDRENEIDFIAKIGQKLLAIEVKSGKIDQIPKSLNVFNKKYPKAQKIIISDDKNHKTQDVIIVNKEDFFLNPENIIKI